MRTMSLEIVYCKSKAQFNPMKIVDAVREKVRELETQIKSTRREWQRVTTRLNTMLVDKDRVVLGGYANDVLK